MIEIDLGKPHLTLAAVAFLLKLPGWGSGRVPKGNRGVVEYVLESNPNKIATASPFLVREKARYLSWVSSNKERNKVTTWGDFQLLAVLLGEDNDIPAKTVKQNLTMLRRISQTALEDKGIT